MEESLIKNLLLLFLSFFFLSNCTIQYDCAEKNAFEGVWYVHMTQQNKDTPRQKQKFIVSPSGEFVIRNYHGTEGMNHYKFYMASERKNEYIYMVRVLDSEENEVNVGYLKLRMNGDNLFSSDIVSDEYLVVSELSQYLFAVSEAIAPTYGYE